MFSYKALDDLSFGGSLLRSISVDPPMEDLAASASHHKNVEYCPEGIPVEQAICLLLAAFAALIGFLFNTITMLTMGNGRKRRSLVSQGKIQETPLTFAEMTMDVFWHGKTNRPLTAFFALILLLFSYSAREREFFVRERNERSSFVPNLNGIERSLLSKIGCRDF